MHMKQYIHAYILLPAGQPTGRTWYGPRYQEEKGSVCIAFLFPAVFLIGWETIAHLPIPEDGNVG